ncbi:MAG TPA: glycosyltransferase family 2 protein [Thermomicrobiaceae bacterium]|nr:glycosyltransferase family 2 protein [Thermomicrobiaceae bacterium]
MEHLAIVIINHNTSELLLECLGRLTNSRTTVPSTIYVVDNGSTDDSLARLAERFPEVVAIAAGRNLGFAGGNNLALRRALADVPPGADRAARAVLLLNSDCFVEPETLARLTRFLDEHPEAGVVGPRLTLPDGRLDLACRRSFPTPASAFWKLTGLARLFPNSPRFARYNLTFLDPGQVAAVDAVVGACMLVRLSAVDDAGLLDEAFFMYGEDLDWAFRIKEQGWQVYYNPAARALHFKGATSSKRSYRLIIAFYHAMYLFHRKHYAARTFVLVNWLIALGIVARGGFALLLNLLRPRAAKRVA